MDIQNQWKTFPDIPTMISRDSYETLPVMASSDSEGTPRSSLSPDLVNEQDLFTTGSVVHHFEGVEKTLEVNFRCCSASSYGLRSLTRDTLDLLCSQAKCSILSVRSNCFLDAYVLSESSLFVYKNLFIMKTCGTTTPLLCLNSLIEICETELVMAVVQIKYTHKNLLFPSAQLYPHSCFDDEIKYISQQRGVSDRLKATSHILGPLGADYQSTLSCNDHYFVYVAKHTDVEMNAQHYYSENMTVYCNCDVKVSICKPVISNCMKSTNGIMMSMMMFQLDEDVMDIFYQSKNGHSGSAMTRVSKINTLLHKDAIVDDFAFEPCGYSMNAIHGNAYYTIHITPEPQCSYVSYETNAACDDYLGLLKQILRVFRPEKFVATFHGDENKLLYGNGYQIPTLLKSISVNGCGDFKRTSTSMTGVHSNQSCFMGCFVSESRR